MQWWQETDSWSTPGYQTARQQNPYLDYLQESPEWAYYSSPTIFQQNMRAPEKKYLQGQFQSTYQDFMGTLGQQARAGQMPSMSFQDYLEESPFTKRYSALTPQQAGRTTGRFSPGTRQIYY